MKNCIKCSCELTDITWASDQKINYINKCRECIKVEKREYNKEWNKKHPGKSAAATKRHKLKLRCEDPVRARAQSAYSDCKKRAFKNNMMFDLTPNHVLQIMRETFTCPYLGVLLTFEQGEKQNSLASVDRIDSTKGYIKDNIQVISYLANLMKSHATDAELLQFAHGVIGMLGLGGLRTAEKLADKAAK